MISLELTTFLLGICYCSCGLVYIEDKTFTRNYIEGDVIYTDNVTASKFIHCASICIKKCKQSCSLISFTEGTCRCYSYYARKTNGQYAPNGEKTMYFRMADTDDGANGATTADSTRSFMSSSLKEETQEYSPVMCNNTPSTIESCKTVPSGEYYIRAFNTDLTVTFSKFLHTVFLTTSYGFTFNFEHQADGSYLIHANINSTTNHAMYVNITSMNMKLSISSSPDNLTYYYLEYQPEGSFKLRVRSLDYYITRSNLLLKLTNKTYGHDEKFLIETTRPAWDIIFRIPTGSPYNIYQAFLYGKQQLMTNSCEVDTDGRCKYSFTRKDDLFRDWWNGCLSLCKIKYSLMKDDIELLAFEFDGMNTSPETWFVAGKLQRCRHFPNVVTNLSLTAVESGEWFFKITDKRLQMNIFGVHYENQTDPANRKLAAVIFNATSKKPCKHSVCKSVT
ncbi:hypothetical protein ACJMK2_039508 [Sinanodonta woodiana]|uniref:Uncharacterized protein n=1 Tax=Sinanodonta woodiana TaxID=1069815 RepID=A0ABD3WC84_SINWO